MASAITERISGGSTPAGAVGAGAGRERRGAVVECPRQVACVFTYLYLRAAVMVQPEREGGRLVAARAYLRYR